MKRTLVVIAVIAVATGFLFAMRTPSTAVKLCRVDAQRFAEETASYDAEYDSLYGATTLGQRTTGELMDRDKELITCLETDPGNKEQYTALIHRNGDIEGNRYFKFLLDTNQLQDFAQFERNQQAVQLAKYRKEQNP